MLNNKKVKKLATEIVNILAKERASHEEARQALIMAGEKIGEHSVIFAVSQSSVEPETN